MTYLSTFTNAMVYPLVVITLIVIVYCIRKSYAAGASAGSGSGSDSGSGSGSSSGTVESGEVDEELAVLQRCEELDTECWKVVLFFLFLVYPSVSSTLLKLYRCDLVEGVYYLMADYRVICYDDSWWPYGIWGFVMMLVYPIGVPLLYYILLWSNSEALHDENHPDHGPVSTKLKFIYKAYEPEYWYFELVWLAYKLLLTGVIIFARPNTTAQVAYGFVLAIFFMCIHVQSNAFVKDEEDRLQFISVLAIVLTLFGGLVYKSDMSNEDAQGMAMVDGLLMLINVGVIGLFLVQTFVMATKKPKGGATAKLALKVGMNALKAPSPPPSPSPHPT
jgi:hypothetical protein